MYTYNPLLIDNIYILIWQSNAWGSWQGNSFTPSPIPWAYILDGASFQPLSFSNAQWVGGFWPEIWFAVESNRLLLWDVYIIKHAQWWTSLADDWNPETGFMYAWLLDKIDLAAKDILSKWRIPQVVAVMRQQWERDATDQTDADNYRRNLPRFFHRLREDVGNDTLQILVWMLNSDLPAWTYPYVDEVRQGQIYTLQQDHHSYKIALNINTTHDWVHYTANAMKNLGILYARQTKKNTRRETNFIRD